TLEACPRRQQVGARRAEFGALPLHLKYLCRVDEAPCTRTRDPKETSFHSRAWPAQSRHRQSRWRNLRSNASMVTKVAVIQKPPVLLDREKSIARALESIGEAVREGASLLVFPEAYLPGYPTWIWRLKPGGDMALSNEIHALLRENAVDLGSDHL